MNESSGNSPLSSEQLIYLEFNGGDNLSYRGELLSLDGISVESSGVSAARIDRLDKRANSAFSARGIRFCHDRRSWTPIRRSMSEKPMRSPRSATSPGSPKPSTPATAIGTTTRSCSSTTRAAMTSFSTRSATKPATWSATPCRDERHPLRLRPRQLRIRQPDRPERRDADHSGRRDRPRQPGRIRRHDRRGNRRNCAEHHTLRRLLRQRNRHSEHLRRNRIEHGCRLSRL